MHIRPVFLGLQWTENIAMGCELLHLVLFLPLTCPRTPIRLGHLIRGLSLQGPFVVATVLMVLFLLQVLAICC